MSTALMMMEINELREEIERLKQIVEETRRIADGLKAKQDTSLLLIKTKNW